jgi:hypothetical protein
LATWITAAGLIFTIVAGLVAVTLYVARINARVDVAETNLRNLEKSQDALKEALRRELDRLEMAAQRGSGIAASSFEHRRRHGEEIPCLPALRP